MKIHSSQTMFAHKGLTAPTYILKVEVNEPEYVELIALTQYFRGADIDFQQLAFEYKKNFGLLDPEEEEEEK